MPDADFRGCEETSETTEDCCICGAPCDELDGEGFCPGCREEEEARDAVD